MWSADLRSRLVYVSGALICAAALVAGCVGEAEQLPLHRCAFLRLSGYPCALCGTTRSFFLAAKGAWNVAIQQSPLGALVYVAIWFALGCFVYRSFRPVPSQSNRHPAWLPRVLVIGTVILVIANWAYRLAMGLK